MPASEQSRSNFCKQNKQIFDPCRDLFLNPLSSHSYGVLILNSPTKLVNDDLWKIWNFADLRVLVDGGSESWVVCKKIKDLSLPHLVTGDFDSITDETLLSFKQNEEVKVINTPDQNATDFTKALIELDSHRANSGIDNVYVVTEMIEGRIDHVMANINTLFTAAKQFPHLRVYRLSSDSISWLLTPGSSSIGIPEVLRDNQEWCSLVPVGAPAVITTSGLKWNLDNHRCLFGEMVSTSNTYDGSPVVEIQTDSPILWSMCTSGLKCKV
ncbi:thiamin pyrophosphokinase 1 isoform X2 [Coccinella septempunctata]|uniref:thiamin pyrophosphokinase 1 isoform X2 n=1 Tax=Coccinella septempunctata TaxID=41139 RepID=UPI001D07EC55|nr:thiamin pyrophosphokinase 1 isoform X2 [Coccinella septempunctata]